MWEPVEVWEWLADRTDAGRPARRFWHVCVRSLAEGGAWKRWAIDVMETAVCEADPLFQEGMGRASRQAYWQQRENIRGPGSLPIR